MTPIISPWLFYLIDIMPNIYFLFLAFIVIVLLNFFIKYVLKENLNNQELLKKIPRKTILILSLLFFASLIFTPTKKAMYEMAVSNVITYENIETVSNTIKDSVDYIFDKFNGN